MKFKVECRYCGKIITEPFIDTDQEGKMYFFCNPKHRDEFEAILLKNAFIMSPFGVIFLLGKFIKEKLKGGKKNGRRRRI